MKKLTKRLTAVIMATAMAASMAVSANAAQSTKNTADAQDDHFFLTKNAPTEITEYVKDYFTTYTYNELNSIGFTDEEIAGMKLAPAITAYEYDECDFEYYYFPILYNGDIIATITAFEYDTDSYTVQLGKTNLASALNELDGNSQSPYSLIISDEGFFAINPSGDIEILQIFNKGTSDVYSSKSVIEIPSVTFAEIESENNNVLTINNAATYTEKTKGLKTLRSISENYLNVPIVENVSPPSYPNGACWAASCASIIKYSIITTDNAATIRDNLIDTTGYYHEGGTDFAPGTSENTANLLSKKIPSVTYNYYNNGWPSFTEIQNKINADKPIYMNWQNFGAGGGAHATVLRGYYYNMSMPTNIAAAKKISMMDPNNSQYVLIAYGSYFNFGTKSYTMYGTVK